MPTTTIIMDDFGWTTSNTTEPTDGRFYWYSGNDTVNIDDGRYTKFIFGDGWEEPKKKKLTDIIGEPDWRV